MIILLSPAKTLNYESSKNLSDFSSPVFLNKSKKLIDELKKKKPKDLSENPKDFLENPKDFLMKDFRISYELRW